MIFQYLPLFYRLKCKEVCLRWYELLMTRAIFRQDRHIYFTECIIMPCKPPMSVFLNSRLPYNILTITAPSSIIKNFETTIDLWSHLNMSVTELNIEFNPCLYKILIEMPILKTVCVRFFSEIRAPIDLTQLNEEHPNREFLEKIEKLRFIIPYRHFPRFSATFGTLIKLSPSNVDIVYVPLSIDLSPSEFKKAEYMQSLGVDTETTKKLLNLDGWLPYKRLELIYARDNPEPPFDLIKALLGRFDRMNDVSFCGDASKLKLAFPQITELKFARIDSESTSPIRSLKYLELLENLKVLKIYLSDWSFGKEPINLPKLQTLSLGGTIIDDSECLTALANSFPNLRKFHGTLSTSEHPMIIQMMFKN